MAVFYGTTKDDSIYGTTLDDSFHISTGKDYINGRGGRDTLIFDGSYEDYGISWRKEGTSFVVYYYTESATSNSVRCKSENIESLIFSNGMIVLDNRSLDTVNYIPEVYFDSAWHLESMSADVIPGASVAEFFTEDLNNDIIEVKLIDDFGGTFAISGDEVIVLKPLQLSIEISSGKIQVSQYDLEIQVTDSFGNVARDRKNIGVYGYKIDLNGTDSAEKIYGNWGEDTITPGLGRDVIFGQPGSDTFRFLSVDEIGLGKNGDIIKDFTDGDLIDLGSIDANSIRRGNQNFDFIGKNKDFSGRPCELRHLFDKWKIYDSTIEGDVDGDKKADFSLKMTTSDPFLWDTYTRINAFDFVL